MTLPRILPLAIPLLAIPLLAAGLGAQTTLVYDNGPFETAPGLSVAQINGLGHWVLGWTAQRTATLNVACFDEFVVPTTMTVEEIEYFTYQPGGGAGPSTITSAFLTVYDTDPHLGGPPMTGSPQPTFDLFTTPSNPLANAWTGVFRVHDNSLTMIDRAIMGVRVKLEDAAGTPTPLVLTPGTYWLRLQSSGSLASRPSVPPVACTGQRVTGNAFQGSSSFLSIANNGDPQGLPFRLYGTSAGGSGSITQVATGCGGTGLTVCSAPNLGGFVRTTLLPSSSTGIPVIGYDFAANPTPFCSCVAIHTFPIAVWFATESAIDIPVDVSFAGLEIAVQGAELFGTGGGCTNPPVNLTDAFLVRVNS